MRYSGDNLKSKILSSDLKEYGLYKYANSKSAFTINTEKNTLIVGKISFGIAVEIEKFFEIELQNRKYKIIKEITSGEYYDLIKN